ncbi:MAG: dephospho-CoA kinase [Terracidiphilus sp.]|nr:dephospho-CoA kinase [Terracidiphilus sp.]
MLRVGLTGGLGSGKSTVAAMLRELGAQVIEADALGRTLMEPGQPVYSAIVERFGPDVVGADGSLNRTRLADLAFHHGRLQELNAIVHLPVIEAQARWMDQVFARDSSAVAVIESALIFEVVRDAQARGEKDGVLADWRKRIDRIIVVTAPDDLKISRYAARIQALDGGKGISLLTIEADARNRLAHQVPDAEKVAEADYVLDNSGDIESLRAQVEAIWPRLLQANFAESNKSGL